MLSFSAASQPRRIFLLRLVKPRLRKPFRGRPTRLLFTIIIIQGMIGEANYKSRGLTSRNLSTKKINRKKSPASEAIVVSKIDIIFMAYTPYRTYIIFP